MSIQYKRTISLPIDLNTKLTEYKEKHPKFKLSGWIQEHLEEFLEVGEPIAE